MIEHSSLTWYYVIVKRKGRVIMDKYTRHKKVWRVLYHIIHRHFVRLLNMSFQTCRVEGPCIVIPNHVTAIDPLMVAMSFPDKQMYFVASEHLFRKGFISALLNWLVEPIPRRKASSGVDSVMAILRHLRAGHSVCLFAEGEATWNGRSGSIFPATGKMVQRSGATLITYRLEGAYLTDPRWSSTLHRGRIYGHPVGIYPPETLKGMTPKEIDELINGDIYEDAWERQKTEHVRFKGRRRAEFIETALFMCPKCGCIGTLKGRGDRLSCSCGMSLEYTEEGSFQPPQPFENIAQWDDWQHEQLKEGSFPHEGETLFSDGDMSLVEIGEGHRQLKLGRGELRQYPQRISCAGHDFELADITDMAMVQTGVLLFSHGGKYYEIRTKRPCCLRKYLAVWKNSHLG